MNIINYPTGSIISYGGVAVDGLNLNEKFGWLRCDGQSYNGNLDKYEALWNLIGNTFGGTGKSSFNVPNLGQRIPRGVVASPSGTGVNGNIGSWHGANSVTLTSSESGVASHTHTINDPGHTHTISDDHTHSVYYQSITTYVNSGAKITVSTELLGGSTATTSTSSTPSATMSNASVNMGALSNNTAVNASQSHTNIQPVIYLHYLIKL